jgi:hypothetical protein
MEIGIDSFVVTLPLRRARRCRQRTGWRLSSRKWKARTASDSEKALLAPGFPRVYIFRQAYIYPVKPRKEPTFGYRLLRAAYPVFRALLPNLVVRSDDLGRAMVDVSVPDTGERENRVFENREIVAMINAAQTHNST